MWPFLVVLSTASAQLFDRIRKRQEPMCVQAVCPEPPIACFNEGVVCGLAWLGEVQGGITKAGDVTVRRALCQAATVMMHRGRSTWLRTWAAQVARRRGAKRAMVALARRIAVVLHRMWIEDTDFRSDTALPHTT
jgi:hypothetical protein